LPQINHDFGYRQFFKIDGLFPINLFEHIINIREAKKRRDRSKEIHLDIQDKIRRQVPDIKY
jgi:hypothetical protein